MEKVIRSEPGLRGELPASRAAETLKDEGPQAVWSGATANESILKGEAGLRAEPAAENAEGS